MKKILANNRTTRISDSQTDRLVSPPSHRLVAVILNYRTSSLVQNCLETLCGQIEPGRDEVVIVDNASGDGSWEAIQNFISERSWGDWARVVVADVNGGFSCGNNTGIRVTDAAFYLLLNSDTLVRPGAVAELLRAAESFPQAGLLGPRLEYEDGRPQNSAFRRITPLGQLVESSGLSILSRILHRHVVAIPVADEPHLADWLSFACVIIRREALEKIGPMDEGMFMYFEDVDMGNRIRSAGFSVWYWPQAQVVHLRGGSSDVKQNAKLFKRQPAYFYAARARYFYREFGLLGLISANILWTIGTMLNTLCWFLTGRPVRLSKNAWKDIWCCSAITPAGKRGVWIDPPVKPLILKRSPEISVECALDGLTSEHA